MMKYRGFTVAPLLPLLAACGGGGTSSMSGPLPQSESTRFGSAALGSMNRAQALTETQSDAMLRPRALYTPSANDLLYVSNVGNNSIAVYHHNVDGNAAPLYVIAGPNTRITSPGQLPKMPKGTSTSLTRRSKSSYSRRELMVTLSRCIY